MKTGVTVRKAMAKDAAVIVQLWKEFMEEADKMLIKKNPAMKAQLAKKSGYLKNYSAFIRKKLRSGNAVVFLAEFGSHAVGYSLNYVKENIPIYEIEKTGYVSDLYIKKEFRGMGIASAFKKEAFKWFRKKGIKYASIMFFVGNGHAHRIYRKWGFSDFHMEMRAPIA